MAGGKRIVAKSRLYLEGLRIHQAFSLDELAGRLLASARDMITAYQDEYVRMRAGGIAVGGTAVVLPSPPEPRLPAVVAAALRAGASYIGDEIVNLDPILVRAHAATTLPLLVDARDLTDFPELGRERIRFGRDRGDPGAVQAKTPRRPVRPDELGAEKVGSAPLAAIVFPDFEPGAETRLEPVSSGAHYLFATLGAILNMHVYGDRSVTFAHRLLETVPARRLVIGSVDAAGRLLASWDRSEAGVPA